MLDTCNTLISAIAERRPPWVVLVSGFLLILALFGLIELLVELYFLGAPQFAGITFGQAWAAADQWKYYRRGGQLVVFLSGAALLWLRPRWCKPVLVYVCVVQLMLGSLAIMETVSNVSAFFGFALKATLLVCAAPKVAIPIYGLWYVHRIDGLRNPAITACGGLLLVYGALECIGSTWLLAITHGKGPPFSFSITIMLIVALLTSIVLFASGLMLIVRGAGLIRIAWIVLAATAIGATPWLWSSMSDPSHLAYMGHVKYVHLFSQQSPVVAALFLLVFAHRFRNRLGFRYPLCFECGYDLTGNTSGVCPECGTEIVHLDEGSATPGNPVRQ